MKPTASCRNSARWPSQRSSSGHASWPANRAGAAARREARARGETCPAAGSRHHQREKRSAGLRQEGLGLPVDQLGDVLLKCGQAGRRRDLPLLSQPRDLVVQRIDNRGEQETRPIVVELDRRAAALGRMWKLQALKKQTSGLLSCAITGASRRAAACQVMRPVTRWKARMKSEDLGEDRGGDDLMSAQPENSPGTSPASRRPGAPV